MASKKPGVKSDLAGLKVMQTSLQKMVDGHYVVQVGIFGEKGARKNTENDGMTNAEVGLINEMGSVSRNTPRRSFLWDTFANHGKDMVPVLAKPLAELFKKGKVEEYLKLVGIAATNLVLEAFDTSGWGAWKPNAPETIAAKGSDKPLIDTAQLWQSVSSRTAKAS